MYYKSRIRHFGLLRTDENTLQSIKKFLLSTFLLVLSGNAFAAQITGTVTNGTSNKPAAGDEVVLLSLAGGMDEVAHTRTDAQGHFKLDAQEQGQKLVRVDHQGVNYFKPATAGTMTIDVTVYDAAKNVENLIGEGRVFRFQTSNDKLEVQEMFIVRNESSPPRTKTAYEFDLPAGAKIADAMAEGPSGMPTNVSPTAVAGKQNRYSFPFPIRPGRARFQVTYTVPYAGTREFKVTPDLPLAEFGVMIPKSMQFASTVGNFQPAQDEAGMTVYVAKSLAPNKEVRFSVSGEGTMPAEGQSGASAPAGGQQEARPGGGLGNPIEAPDPLSSSRWYLIAIFIVVLAGGGYWLYRMQRGGGHAGSHQGRTLPARNRPPAGESFPAGI